MTDVRHLHQCEFDGKALIFRAFVVDVALVGDVEPGQQQRWRRYTCLFRIFSFNVFRYFHQLHCPRILRNEEAAQMFTEAYDEIMSIETFLQHFVKD